MLVYLLRFLPIIEISPSIVSTEVVGSGMIAESPVRMMLPSDVYTSCESSVMWAEVKNPDAS